MYADSVEVVVYRNNHSLLETLSHFDIDLQAYFSALHEVVSERHCIGDAIERIAAVGDDYVEKFYVDWKNGKRVVPEFWLSKSNCVRFFGATIDDCFPAGWDGNRDSVIEALENRFLNYSSGRGKWLGPRKFLENQGISKCLTPFGNVGALLLAVSNHYVWDLFDRNKESYIRRWSISRIGMWKGVEGRDLAVEALEDVLWSLPGYRDASREDKIRIIRESVFKYKVSERKGTSCFLLDNNLIAVIQSCDWLKNKSSYEFFRSYDKIRKVGLFDKKAGDHLEKWEFSGRGPPKVKPPQKNVLSYRKHYSYNETLEHFGITHGQFYTLVKKAIDSKVVAKHDAEKLITIEEHTLKEWYDKQAEKSVCRLPNGVYDSRMNCAHITKFGLMRGAGWNGVSRAQLVRILRRNANNLRRIFRDNGVQHVTNKLPSSDRNMLGIIENLDEQLKLGLFDRSRNEYLSRYLFDRNKFHGVNAKEQIVEAVEDAFFFIKEYRHSERNTRVRIIRAKAVNYESEAREGIGWFFRDKGVGALLSLPPKKRSERSKSVAKQRGLIRWDTKWAAYDAITIYDEARGLHLFDSSQSSWLSVDEVTRRVSRNTKSGYVPCSES